MEHSDYQSSLSTDLVSGKSTPIDLPKSNVLEYKAENGCKLIVRPSGTEPEDQNLCDRRSRRQSRCPENGAAAHRRKRRMDGITERK